MEFLAPTTIAVAAGLTIPPLIALYFLKLRREELRVSSTLLWKKAIEDLRVNAPFRRLRGSLLLLLQLLLLAIGALALGKPMLQAAARQEDVVVILVDHSASMNVMEEDERTRLDRAKEQAGRIVSGMKPGARALVIAFCDQPATVSSFDSDRRRLLAKIDSIEPTQSTTRIAEALNLAQAYAQKLMIGGPQAGLDVSPDPAAAPALVYILTDGRIEDLEDAALQHFEASSISVVNVADRRDNVGIVAMNARRRVERPEYLQVTATIENFGPEAIKADAVLYVDGRHRDVQTVQLGAAAATAGASPVGTVEGGRPEPAALVAFDPIEHGGTGIVEVALQVSDALSADDRAWAVVRKPDRPRVLLVADENPFLDQALMVLAVELVRMSPGEYESALESELSDGRRSLFDCVIFDRHATGRLPRGNYFFWGAVPDLEGLRAGGMVRNRIVFHWDETHPILRHVGVESLFVREWLRLNLPSDAVSIIEGETSPVLAYLARGGSQYLVSAFSLLLRDEQGQEWYNTDWMTTVDFVVFMQNAVEFLSADLAVTGGLAVTPGQPVTLPLVVGAEFAVVERPDGRRETLPVVTGPTLHYARTRRAGVYRVRQALPEYEAFAVNLFNRSESQVAPAESIHLGAEVAVAQKASLEVPQPAWRYFVSVLLGLLILEWIVYSRRIRV